MAGHAARRIAACALAWLLLSACAFAGWENTRFCRLSEDRLLLIAGNQRFVLTHGAAWEPADPAQKDALDKWLTQAKLSTDLGQLVASEPSDREVPLAGEVDTSTTAAGDNQLVFKHGSVPPVTVTLSGTVTSGKLAGDGDQQFAAIAKSYNKAPSTLLVALADKTGQLSGTAAWGAVIGRLKARPEFFAYIDKQQGLLWLHHAGAATAHKPVKDIYAGIKEIKPVESAAKPEAGAAGPIGFVVPFLGLVLGLVAGLLVGTRLGKQKGISTITSISPSVPVERPAPVPATAPFSASSHERELIQKVRDETRKLGWPADHVPSAEETVVGQMLERFEQYPAVKAEIELLFAYRRYKEDHKTFEKQMAALGTELREA